MDTTKGLIIDAYPTLPFGSRAWGGATQDSDLDVVMDMDDFSDVYQLLKAPGFTSVVYHIYCTNRLRNAASVKFVQKGLLYNIIFYDKDLLFMVEEMNKYMALLPPELLLSKEGRIKHCEGFVDSYLDIGSEITPWS